MFIDLDTLQSRLFKWSLDTFGSVSENGPLGPLTHLKKEVDEAIKNPHDIVEFADCYMLLPDAVSRAGFKMSDVIYAVNLKFEVNKSRKWAPRNSDGVIEHVRGAKES